MSSPPPEAPGTPQAWCRRILNSLALQQVAGREAGYLDMLLTYFIELEPSFETFDSLLQQFANDSRPGIADAATLLLRSWERGRGVPTAPGTLPPLSEALRTLGALLDESAVRGAFILVEAERIGLHPFGGTPATFGPRELQQEVGARTALRGQVQRPAPLAADRFESALRAVGAELDGVPAQTFEVVVTRHTVVVDGSAGFTSVYTLGRLGDMIQAALPSEDTLPPEE